MNKSVSFITALLLTGLVLILPLALPQKILADPTGAAPPTTDSIPSKKKEAVAEVPYKEGTHYQVLEQFPASSKPTVTELFSIYCVGCYRWEKGALVTLKENLAKRKIEFKQAHMFFMGKYGKQATTALAMTQGTELYEPVKNALFNKIHVVRTGDWKNEDDFFSTLSKAGLTRKAFEQQQNGPVALKSVLDWNRYSGNIDAVPSFVVNNRYLVKMGGIKSFDEMDQLIAWLTKLPTTASPINPKASDGAPKSSAENTGSEKKGS